MRVDTMPRARGRLLLGLAVSVASMLSGLPRAQAACTRCSSFDFLCCEVPSDGRFYLTEFTGGGMACGGTADGGWYYATSWVRWSCGAKLEVRNPETGACVVVEVADAGPAAWVEERAGTAILDASPLVCRDLFGASSCGWSDRLVVEVTEVAEDTETGPGGCGEAPPDAPPLAAEVVEATADAGDDPSGAATYRLCAGEAVTLSVELRNVGSAVWTDEGDTTPESYGRAVHLGVPVGEVDEITGRDWVSLGESTNDEVRSASTSPAGRDCSDGAGCERTRFVLEGRGPAEPGLYESVWQLVDEGRGWFGPELRLSFSVEDCGVPDDPPPGDDPLSPDDPPPDDDDPLSPDDPPPDDDDPLSPDDPPPDDDPRSADPDDQRLGVLPGMAGGCQVVPTPAAVTGPWLLLALLLLARRLLRA